MYKVQIVHGDRTCTDLISPENKRGFASALDASKYAEEVIPGRDWVIANLDAPETALGPPCEQWSSEYQQEDSEWKLPQNDMAAE